MWDEKVARRYDEWFRTPQGAFALKQERRLVERLVSSWPRRGQSLLDIGCGTGLFLELFYDMGFDVTGLDASESMLEAARARMEKRADLHLGRAEHLPFGDNEYDFATLVTVLEFVNDPARVVEEAARVARKGLLVAFVNRHSIYFLQRGLRLPFLSSGTLRSAHNWPTAGSVRRLVQAAVGNKPVHLGSVLPLPTWTWRNAAPWRWLNGVVYPGCCGAFCALRADMAREKPLTPLLAFKNAPARTA